MTRTDPLRAALADALPDRPFAVRLWDGTELPATGAENGDSPVFELRSPRALSHLMRSPGQLGLGRAYVSGDLAVDDIDAVLRLLDGYQPPPIPAGEKARLALAAAKAGALTKVPRAPKVELRLRGERHSVRRDKAAVTYHYDVGNDFFRLLLGPSLVYSCAVFSRGAQTLEEAQATKLDLVCTKLALQPGERVLDVGCGWGSFAIHAAREHGVHVTGITLSEPQATLARARAREAGVADRVDFRVADYRELRGEQFDAIASIGMVEHVGHEQIDAYAQVLAGLLGPGGRLLNHGIARLRHGNVDAGPFSERFVFPDGEPLQLSRVQLALERAGFTTHHVEGFADDYAQTLRHWTANLEADLPRAVALAGEERVRVWLVYLRAARNGFETGFTSIYQVRATRA